ncbi:MAG: hypothetical protein J6N78_01595, partial [Clostridia bacterium]|nr:hypothetical protein [Clostridia bacterium]
LVITIIVLLILAGISISAITGSGSVLDKAKDAKTKTNAAQAKEQTELLISNYVQSYFLDNNTFDGTRYTDERSYAKARLTRDGEVHGNHKISISNDNKITVKDKNNDDVLATGTIDDVCKITWD